MNPVLWVYALKNFFLFCENNVMSNNHLRAILLTALGIFIMSFESLLIKLTSISSLSYSFYIGIFMFFSMNFLLLKNEKNNFISAYSSGFLIILLCGAFFWSVQYLFYICN